MRYLPYQQSKIKTKQNKKYFDGMAGIIFTLLLKKIKITRTKMEWLV